MKTVTMTETQEADFYAGDDGAYYTPVDGVEARCRWCRLWGHQDGLFHREILFTAQVALVCGRHVRRDDDWREVV